MQAAKISLSSKFGGLYALLVVLLLSVGAVVLTNLENMTRDAHQVLEESRESVVVSRMRSRAQTVESLIEELSSQGQISKNAQQHLLRSTASLAADLKAMHSEDDPSRSEHQEEEDEVTRKTAERLASIEAGLKAPYSAMRQAEMLGSIQAIRHSISLLDEETQSEVMHAEHDFEDRVEWTRKITLYTAVFGGIILIGALLFVFRGVVVPLRTLREGAEQFGRGDLLHRIQISSGDEVGLLATTFNEMADRISRTQFELENRVRERTGEFIRAARLADLGIFAAGIAHEINTPLASIVSCADGLSRKIAKRGSEFAEGQEYLSTISSEAFRARDITSRLLALSKQGGQELAAVAMQLVCAQVDSAVAPLLKSRDMQLHVEGPTREKQLHIDAGELVQVLVNLILNARDASEDGATIQLRYHFDLDRLVLEVIDHGGGIAEEHLNRVFEPFFTTKGRREGTGLGLALVSALVEARGGVVRVESELDHGTRFTVDLPINWMELE